MLVQNSPAGKSEPTPCAVGYYQERNGSDLCDQCPAGFYCPGGHNNKIECPEGTKQKFEISKKICAFTNENFLFFFGKFWTKIKQPLVNKGSITDCTECGLGFYQNQTGQVECISCPVGQYCPDKNTTTPIICPAGTYQLSFSIIFSICSGNK